MNGEPLPSSPGPVVEDPALGRRFITAVLVALVVVLSYSLIKVFAFGQLTNFVIMAAAIVIILWTFFSRDAWWIMMPLTVSFGGFLYFGFKILVHELGLVLCLLPLVVSVAVGLRRVAGRSPVPRTAWILLVYLFAHFGVSAYLAKTQGLPGIGHVLRVYMQGFWPLVFLVAFHLFGQTSKLKTAFVAMYITALARIVLGLIAFFFPTVMYIPGINLIMPGAATGGMDLRTSALMFATLNICLMMMTGSLARRLLYAVLLAASGILTLMGSGRVAFLMFCFIPLFVALLRRRVGMVIGLGIGILVAAIFLNQNPTLLYDVPDPVRRTLSVLVLQQRTHDVHRGVESSNIWHWELISLARKRWLTSPLTTAVGNRIYPFSEDFYSRTANLEARMEIAARLGSYESGLWTMLAVLGTTGFLLYLLLFRKLLKGLLREVWERGVHDFAHAFYFLAICYTLTWALFCYVAGHFPSEALLYAAIAHAAFEDQKTREAAAALPAAPPGSAPA